MIFGGFGRLLGGCWGVVGGFCFFLVLCEVLRLLGHPFEVLLPTGIRGGPERLEARGVHHFSETLRSLVFFGEIRWNVDGMPSSASAVEQIVFSQALKITCSDAPRTVWFDGPKFPKNHSG